MNEVYIVAAQRTPIGSFQGSLGSFSATQLGSIAIKSAIEQVSLDPSLVDEVFMGNVISANIGQAPARQAALMAGLPEKVVCTTVNKVCASGTKAIMLAAQAIMCGLAEVVVAGGMESMTNIPYYLEKARSGYKLGHGQLTDGLIKDGLWDVYNNFHMGNAAELTAQEMGISRQMQDEHAIESYQKSAKATMERAFSQEIVPVELKQKGKESIWLNEDEEYKNVNFAKIPELKPVFQADGTITAANASTINDGAAALILMSKEKALKLGLKPLAKILSFADAAQAPVKFTTSPSLAIPKAIKLAGLTLNEVDYFEINEAFSVVSIANNQLLGLNPKKVNIWGGAVSLGHPLGCSGARILTTLLSILTKTNTSIGVAGICNGGGGASAIVIQRI